MLFPLRKYLLSALLTCVLSVSLSSAPCYAQTDEVVTQELTLLQNINTAITADSEGFSYETLTALSATLLSTDNPLVELATFTGELTAGYAGAKLSNNEGLSLYLALNPLSETHTVSYGDEYSIALGSHSVAIRLAGFDDRFSVDDFGGELILKGSGFSVKTTLEALSTDFDSEERLYLFTDTGMHVNGEGISVTGILEIDGTSADDTFDFSQRTTPLTNSLILNGAEGTDSVIGQNNQDDPTIWIISDETNRNKLTGKIYTLAVINMETLYGGNSDDEFTVDSINNPDGLLLIDTGDENNTLLAGENNSSPQFQACETGNGVTVSSFGPNNGVERSCTEVTLTAIDLSDENVDRVFNVGETQSIEEESGGGSFGIFGILIGLILLGRRLPKNA
ncbi:MAG: hypothetical protein K6L81_06545 [Agarilytica sp.]